MQTKPATLVPRSGPRRSLRDAGRFAARPLRRGFSLLELVVVLAVTLVLTTLLLPALSQVRENVNRIVCSSNQRQLGLGVMMFAKDNRDHFPLSYELESRVRRLRLKQLMTARLYDPDHWDGLGLLFKLGYCTAADCYYCPSHRGKYTLDTYQWMTREPTRIYTNFHYCGHVDWQHTERPRSLDRGAALVISVDALPSRAIPNHHGGMNVLRGDGSVRWHEDPGDRVSELVQSVEQRGDPDGTAGLWGALEELLNNGVRGGK